MTEEPQGPMTARTFARTRFQMWRLTAASLLGLLGLGVTLVHLVWPSPLAFAAFMTLGQGSLAVAMALYLSVIFADLRRRNVL